MYRTIAPFARGRTWRLAAVLGAVLLLTLFAGAQLVSAQTPIEGDEDVACLSLNSNACTANDVDVALIYVLGTPVCQDDGTGTLYADVLFKAEFDPNRSSTYDIGLWISLNGGNAKTDTTNTCYHGILTPLESDFVPPTFNPDGGPYRDLDGDYCGDLVENDGMVYGYVEELRILCTDTAPVGDGLMNTISVCTSWDINTQSVCNGVADAKPNQTSKCYCEDAVLSPPIPIQQIVVQKVTDPDPDPYDASFNFTVTGPDLEGGSANFSLGNGDSWGSGPLDAGGTYVVNELTPPTGWTQTSVVCTDGVNSYEPTGFVMPAGKSVRCIFTNTIQRGKIIVDKVTYPSGDTTLFDFTLTGGPSMTGLTGYPLDQSFELADDTTPYDSDWILPASTTGTYAVAETLNPDYQTWSACYRVLPDETVVTIPIDDIDLLPGETVTCRFFNTFGPTAVEIEYFTATGVKRAITLEWKTVSEVNNLGFNVYRAKKVDGPRTKLNETLIPAGYGNAWGAEYTFEDTTVLGARTYYYWLEAVDGSNATETFGPVDARAK